MSDVALYHGDCLEYMRRMMADKFVDFCITDPPYGIGIAGNPFRQKFEPQAWDDQPADREAIAEIFRVSKFQVIWGGNYFDLPPTQCVLVWDKKQPEDFSSSMCEVAWTNFKSPAKMFRYSVTSYEKEHPTQKPLPLMKWIIAKYTKEGDTIFDPFMGSGTTGVACSELGRKFIGCEKNEQYYTIAQRRIESAQMQMVMPL